jgi:hypothetical protein
MNILLINNQIRNEESKIREAIKANNRSYSLSQLNITKKF